MNAITEKASNLTLYLTLYREMSVLCYLPMKQGLVLLKAWGGTTPASEHGHSPLPRGGKVAIPNWNINVWRQFFKICIFLFGKFQWNNKVIRMGDWNQVATEAVAMFFVNMIS